VAGSEGGREGESFSRRVAWRGDAAAPSPAAVGGGGGRVPVEGGARLSQGGWGLGLKSAGKGLQYSGSGTLARLDYQANLTGALASPRLQAAIRLQEGEKIGRASCRERGQASGGAV